MADRNVPDSATLALWKDSYNLTAEDVGDIGDLNAPFSGIPTDLVEGINSKIEIKRSIALAVALGQDKKMANDFKNEIAKDIAIDTGAFTTLYTTPAAMATVLLELDIANTHATDDITVSVTLTSGGTEVYLVKKAPVPVGGALKAVSGQKIVLEAAEVLKVAASVASSADVICSLLEDVN